MTIIANLLNNAVTGASHVAAPGSVTDLGGGIFSVNPATGSIIDNFWNGTFGSPEPTDLTTFKLSFPTQSAGLNVLQYIATDASGHVQPAIGFQVLGYNGTGILGEQINGYFVGAPASFVSTHLNPNQFYVFSQYDLSVTEPGYSGPPAAALVFGQTGPFPNNVPEPSMIALLPLMVIGLIASRMPAVRAMFGPY